MLKITINDAAIQGRLKRFPDAVRDALFAKEGPLADQLVAKAQGRAPHKSGKLAKSIKRRITKSSTRVVARVRITGKARKYGGAQERGARTKPHQIFAAKAKALAFISGGSPVFASSVMHPGATIPAKHFLRDALTSMKHEITAGLTAAVHEALSR